MKKRILSLVLALCALASLSTALAAGTTDADALALVRWKEIAAEAISKGEYVAKEVVVPGTINTESCYITVGSTSSASMTTGGTARFSYTFREKTGLAVYKWSVKKGGRTYASGSGSSMTDGDTWSGGFVPDEPGTYTATFTLSGCDVVGRMTRKPDGSYGYMYTYTPNGRNQQTKTTTINVRQATSTGDKKTLEQYYELKRSYTGSTGILHRTTFTYDPLAHTIKADTVISRAGSISTEIYFVFNTETGAFSRLYEKAAGTTYSAVFTPATYTGSEVFDFGTSQDSGLSYGLAVLLDDIDKYTCEELGFTVVDLGFDAWYQNDKPMLYNISQNAEGMLALRIVGTENVPEGPMLFAAYDKDGRLLCTKVYAEAGPLIRLDPGCSISDISEVKVFFSDNRATMVPVWPALSGDPKTI